MAQSLVHILRDLFFFSCGVSTNFENKVYKPVLYFDGFRVAST